jgi:hypothetical protein
MTRIGFEFPRDESQQWDGFNEAGIEHFSGSPFRSLGREGTQNTSDAAKKSGVPARIHIRRISVPTSSIPGIGDLRGAIKRCQVSAQTEGEKAAQFFENAFAIITKPKVSILQFADTNTIGVKGPCENGFPYFALMKATGQSKKETGTASGSFGIGKFAPYTVSGLRTTFLTTVWEDELGHLQHYVQGKSILMSQKSGSITFRGTGFWGVRKNCLPLIGNRDILPDWLQRDISEPAATGTTLSILGFAATKDWEKILAASIAESFFASISRGHLAVEIEGGPTLNAVTLAQVFEDATISDAIKDQKDEPETFNNSRHFLHALTSSESQIEETENAGLGRCRLHVLVGEDLPKRVAVLRNGMLITSELERLRRFSEFKEFSAVLECLSDKGNALLRAMEPPAHDDFHPARLLTPDQQRVARIALREVADWVREMLRRHAQDPVAEVTEIDELAEFFGDDEDDAPGGSRQGEENPRGTIKIRARPLPPKKSSSSTDESEGSAAGDGGDTGSGASGQGDGRGDGDGGEGADSSNDASDGDSSSGGGGGNKGAPAVTLALGNVRAVMLAPNRRRISFTPLLTGDIRVEVEDSGADTNRLLRITEASEGAVIEGRVRISCSAGKRIAIDLDLERAFDGTIRVKANAI